MGDEVLPRPEKLNGTRSCEMAALLVTLGFEPADNSMAVATGHGIPGGRLGYWRFLPVHPRGVYDLKRVVAHGLDVAACGLAVYKGVPVYREQAVIVAAFHNYRMLVENVLNGTRLRAECCGNVWLLRRVEAAGVPELASRDEVRAFHAMGTRNTELAAALITLGFVPGEFGGGGVAARVQHEARGKVWVFPERSADGLWQLQERMARWQDDVWSARPENTDPLACCADAFWNLRHLRRGLKEAQVFIRAENGRRHVLVRRDAPESVWAQAEKFLIRK